MILDPFLFLLREIAVQAVQNSLSKEERITIKAKTIDHVALSVSRLWENLPDRHVDWDWIDGYSSFKFRYPKRFELALWYKNSLASLSIGRPTYNGTALRLDFVEAIPRNLDVERPKLFPIVLIALSIYGRLLKAEEIRIMKLINEKVKSYYSSYSFTYVVEGDYLYKRLMQSI